MPRRECDRACLSRFVDRYLDAIVTHDPSRLPEAAGARYTENGPRLALGDGMIEGGRISGVETPVARGNKGGARGEEGARNLERSGGPPLVFLEAVPAGKRTSRDELMRVANLPREIPVIAPPGRPPAPSSAAAAPRRSSPPIRGSRP